jgi:catechol 2,3-dioxygenase-like lactoylglutathione lyase family enzyme
MTEKSTITPELKVLDYKKSLEFYTALAGFKVLYTRPEEDFAMLSIGNSRLMIEGLTDKSRTWKTGPLETPFGRGMHFQIEVDDVQLLYENFKNANYPIFLELEEKWYRVNEEQVGHKQFLVQDPDGYLLRFFQNLQTK